MRELEERELLRKGEMDKEIEEEKESGRKR